MEIEYHSFNICICQSVYCFLLDSFGLLGCVAMSDDAWSLRFGNADHCEMWQIDTNWHWSHRSIWFERIENRLFPDLRNLRRKSQKQHFRSPVPPSPPLPTTTTTTITNRWKFCSQAAGNLGWSQRCRCCSTFLVPCPNNGPEIVRATTGHVWNMQKLKKSAGEKRDDFFF